MKIKLLFTAAAITAIMPICAHAAVGGECGENARWSYENGIMTVSGTGAAELEGVHYYNTTKRPFEEYAQEIREVRFKEGITSISEAFCYNMENLRSVSLPKSLEKIGSYAFYGTGLTNAVLPDKCTDIGYSVFENCASLKSVTLPEGLTKVPSNMFSNSGIEAIKLGSNITSIGTNAFKGCESITKLNLPQSLKEIGPSAFSGTGIKELSLSANTIKAADHRTFAHCLSLERVSIADGTSEMPGGIFADCSSLKEVRLPASLEKIGFNAFAGCTSLEQIQLPDKVSSIGEYAFKGCTALKNINLPDGIDAIEQYTFSGCSSLTDVHLPDSINTISLGAFFECTALTGISLPDGITKIARSTFYGCSSLTGVRLPDGIETIGEDAFAECSSLRSLDLPDSVQEISKYAFYKSGIQELYIPSGVTTIPDSCFASCGKVKLHLPPTVERIIKNAFHNTTPVIYAQPESFAYGYAAKNGYELYSDFIPKVGDVVDQIVDSDIYVTLNDKLIPSYCVSGKTLILLRDLERYGFDVRFDEENRIAYADYSPDKPVYDALAAVIYDRNILCTDIRAIVNGEEIETRNTNGYIAVEAERLGNYVPRISCVWQGLKRRLQMYTLANMAHREDLVKAIASRRGIAPKSTGIYFADTEDGVYDALVDAELMKKSDYNGYICPKTGLMMKEFILLAGRAYLGTGWDQWGHANSVHRVNGIDGFIPTYLNKYAEFMYEKGILVPDENNQIYLDGLLTVDQMNYYLDILDADLAAAS